MNIAIKQTFLFNNSMNTVIKNNSREKVSIMGMSGFVSKNLANYLLKNSPFIVEGISSSKVNLMDDNQVLDLLPELIKNSSIIVTSAITPDKDNSINSMLDNIKMSSNLARVLNITSVNHIVYISTIEVYGRKDLMLPLNEQSKIQPTSYYAISKLTSEYIFKKICSDRQIPLTILRLPGVYGPGDTHNSPIKIFITTAIKKEVIKINGHGSQLRDFLYIKDLVEIIKLIISSRITGVYNAVSGKSYSINEILKFMEELCDHPFDIIYSKNLEECSFVFEKPKLLEKIPKFNFTDLRTGIKETFLYYKDELGNVY